MVEWEGLKTVGRSKIVARKSERGWPIAVEDNTPSHLRGLASVLFSIEYESLESSGK